MQTQIFLTHIHDCLHSCNTGTHAFAFSLIPRSSSPNSHFCFSAWRRSAPPRLCLQYHHAEVTHPMANVAIRAILEVQRRKSSCFRLHQQDVCSPYCSGSVLLLDVPRSRGLQQSEPDLALLLCARLRSAAAGPTFALQHQPLVPVWSKALGFRRRSAESPLSDTPDTSQRQWSTTDRHMSYASHVRTLAAAKARVRFPTPARRPVEALQSRRDRWGR